MRYQTCRGERAVVKHKSIFHLSCFYGHVSSFLKYTLKDFERDGMLSVLLL